MSIFNIFKKKPAQHIEVCSGAMIADFYVDEKDAKGCYLHIYAPNGVFEQRVVGYTYGYLLTAVKQGNMREVEAYCTMLWRITQEIYQDLGFANDIIHAINKRDKRLFKQAERNAKAVTPEQIAADEAFMGDVAAYADATPKERKKMRKKWKEEAQSLSPALPSREGDLEITNY